jgi:hypothetical protein
MSTRLYGIVCSVCHRRGLAPVDDHAGPGEDDYVSRHGWALCIMHAERVDPRYPADPLPRAFLSDEAEPPQRRAPLRR